MCFDASSAFYALLFNGRCLFGELFMSAARLGSFTRNSFRPVISNTRHACVLLPLLQRAAQRVRRLEALLLLQLALDESAARPAKVAEKSSDYR